MKYHILPQDLVISMLQDRITPCPDLDTLRGFTSDMARAHLLHELAVTLAATWWNLHGTPPTSGRLAALVEDMHPIHINLWSGR